MMQRQDVLRSASKEEEEVTDEDDDPTGTQNFSDSRGYCYQRRIGERSAPAPAPMTRTDVAFGTTIDPRFAPAWFHRERTSDSMGPGRLFVQSPIEPSGYGYRDYGRPIWTSGCYSSLSTTSIAVVATAASSAYMHAPIAFLSHGRPPVPADHFAKHRFVGAAEEFQFLPRDPIHLIPLDQHHSSYSSRDFSSTPTRVPSTCKAVPCFGLSTSFDKSLSDSSSSAVNNSNHGKGTHNSAIARISDQLQDHLQHISQNKGQDCCISNRELESKTPAACSQSGTSISCLLNQEQQIINENKDELKDLSMHEETLAETSEEALEQISSSTNPSSEPDEGSKIEKEELGKGKRRASEEEVPKEKKRWKKDPKAPKNPRSAYLFYVCEQRGQQVGTSESAQSRFKEIAVNLGAKWKALSEEEKIPYKRMAKKDKIRYQLEKVQYMRSRDDDSE